MKVRVELLTDLTKYHKDLIVGVKGYEIGPRGFWSKNNDNFTTVIFDNGVEIDVLWKSLKIIDEEYLKKQAEEKEKEKILLKEATDIEMYYGPNGGFRYLSFEYPGHSCSIGFYEQALYYEEIFKEYGLEITYITQKSAAQLKEEKELQTAENIVLLKGAKGGLKQLSYSYVCDGKLIDKTIKDSLAISRRLKIFESLNLEVKEETFKK